jgi:thymidylate synthase (FAD)
LTDIILESQFDAELAQHAGSDEFICQAARVSTLGVDALDSSESAGLLNFLMRNRHGSPFEHGFMSFRVTAPIFVWREFMRHRIGFSYNEESGRYKILEGRFYVPPPERALIQVGKPGHYEFIQGSDMDYDLTHDSLYLVYQHAWENYNRMLEKGIAKEVARICLPVATYSTAFVSCNPRSLMSFLSLRTKSDLAAYPSFPQWEISQVAAHMEVQFSQLYPLTYAAFNTHGRVSP